MLQTTTILAEAILEDAKGSVLQADPDTRELDPV
jgi:hypothetical protein